MLRDGIPWGRYMMNALEVTVAKDQVEAACLERGIGANMISC